MPQLLATVLPSTPTAAAVVRDVWEAGDALLPLDPRAPRDAIARVLDRLRPDRLVTDVEPASVDHRRGRALEAPLPTSEDVALVVATSGSTGTPKGVELPRTALDASTEASLARLGSRPGEVWRVPLPLHHVAGLMALRRSWACGTEPDLVAPGDLGGLLAPGADAVAVVPTQLHRWLDRDAGAGPRRVLLGGGPAPASLLERAAVAGLEVTTTYGMTETCGGCVYDGRPLDGVEVTVSAEGRVRLRGSVRFAGYRGDPEATAAAIDEDGWFTTGDLGRVDADGRLTVLGRADDVVVSGGENVPLTAVVEVLRRHPQVADAAALGVPDPEWGQRVHAVVVPDDAHHPPTLAVLREHVRRSHPAAYAPVAVTVVDHLPRDAMGKTTRSALRALIGAR